MELTHRVAKANKDLLDAAADIELSTALARHGQFVTGTEAAALARLSPEELRQFARINDKLFDLANQSATASENDWICGAVC